MWYVKTVYYHFIIFRKKYSVETQSNYILLMMHAEDVQLLNHIIHLFLFHYFVMLIGYKNIYLIENETRDGLKLKLIQIYTQGCTMVLWGQKDGIESWREIVMCGI